MEKSNFSYLEEKSIDLKLINAFGNELDNFQVELNYTATELEEKAESIKKDKDNTDLEDEPEPLDESISTSTFNKTGSFKIDVSRYMKKPTIYVLKITSKFEGEKTYNFVYNFNVRSFSKVKINHLKFSVTNTNEKNDEKETIVEFPKRSFKTIKATQKSVIRLKINVSSRDISLFYNKL